MSQRKDPWRNARFLLEWDGIVQAGFNQVTIPDISIDPIEYREGNELTTVRKIPGQVKYSNIILKRGVTDNMELFEWIKKISEGSINSTRKTVSILILDEKGDEAARWDFAEAWPTKYDSPELNASSNEIAIETLEIAHEGMKRTK
jgi:phage tail-like protein